MLQVGKRYLITDDCRSLSARMRGVSVLVVGINEIEDELDEDEEVCNEGGLEFQLQIVSTNTSYYKVGHTTTFFVSTGDLEGYSEIDLGFKPISIKSHYPAWF